MTVGELIRDLLVYPPETVVLVVHYADHVCDDLSTDRVRVSGRLDYLPEDALYVEVRVPDPESWLVGEDMRYGHPPGDGLDPEADDRPSPSDRFEPGE
jgi:hypothetical protein